MRGRVGLCRYKYVRAREGLVTNEVLTVVRLSLPDVKKILKAAVPRPREHVWQVPPPEAERRGAGSILKKRNGTFKFYQKHTSCCPRKKKYI